MRYSVVAGNRSINSAIYECFEHIEETDASAFVRKFAQMVEDERQQMHTFRELILGGYLGSCGFRVRSELVVATKTPDWAILNARSELSVIVELVNLHTESRIERAMADAKSDRGMWSGWMPDNSRRLYARLEEKASVYRSVVDAYEVPYVVAVYSEFDAAVDELEMATCLHDKDYGIFAREPSTSGVMFFEENAGRYAFSYHANPHATRPFAIPSGIFLRGAG